MNHSPPRPAPAPAPAPAIGASSDGERLMARLHGPADAPALVYLPGIHGDWTLIAGLRHALLPRVRFVEFTYPRTISWSLTEYAKAIEDLLERLGIRRAWVLAESFGSQVAWPVCAQARHFEAQGLILAGGFGRYPIPALPRAIASVVARIPTRWFQRPLRVYAQLARWRFRHTPELAGDIAEFVCRRTDADRRAAVHRLHLIGTNRPHALAASLRIPVHYLTGLVDPIVPWPWIPGWLQGHCPAFRGWRLVLFADHNVLATAPRASARILGEWMGL